MSNQIPEPPQASSPFEPAPIVAHKLDFTSLGLPEYKDAFVLVIDNLFTPEDCGKLLKAAELSKWEPAALNGPPGSSYSVVNTSYRNSSRIILDDRELAGWVTEKLRPYLQEIDTEVGVLHQMYSKYKVKGQTKWGKKKLVGPPVKLSRVNERLRFLKYGAGEFFNRHCDAIYYTPDRREISYYTLQIYLNGDKKSLKGGATRLWSHEAWDVETHGEGGYGSWVDVEARAGRVLIFEQNWSDHDGILHSGEKVTKGEKISVRSDLMYEVIEK